MFDENKLLRIDIAKEAKGVYVIKLIGRIDSDTYGHMDMKVRPLLTSSTRVIILDMDKVDYVSSAGLGVIFGIKNFLEGNKGSLIISSLKPHVKKVFEVVKALPTENVFESREELDAYLDVIQKKEIEKQKGKGN